MAPESIGATSSSSFAELARSPDSGDLATSAKVQKCDRTSRLSDDPPTRERSEFVVNFANDTNPASLVSVESPVMSVTLGMPESLERHSVCDRENFRPETH